MSDLLLGDATATYPVADTCSDSYQEAFRYTALTSGTITELRFRTNANANTACTGLCLAIYSDSAGPATLLGSETFIGEPPTDTWVTLTGLSVDVVAGVHYWLSIKPLGHAVHFNAAAAFDAGTPDWAKPNATSAPLSPWGTTDPGDIYNQGPVGFQALGTAVEALTAGGGGKLEIAITNHHDLETETPASAQLWLHAFKDGQGDILSCDAKTGKVTVSVYSEAARLFDSGRNDKLYRLFIRFAGQAVIWAPAVTTWDFKAGTCIISAVDADRLQDHYLRDGDEAIDPENEWGGSIPADYRGLRLLRDAANNTPEQDARFVAPLGIRDGTNTNTPSVAPPVLFERGNQVFTAMKQLSAGLATLEWELEALDVDDPGAYPDYMKLNTFDVQGVDRTSGDNAVVFHCGMGLRNLSNFRAEPGGFITHAHVLGDGGHPRVTRHHESSSRHRGVYVHWAATQIKVADDATGALVQIAEAFIKAYGLPLQAYTLELKPDALQKWVFGYGFGMGDIVAAAVKRGYFNASIHARIRKVTIKQTSRLKDTTADVVVVPSLVDDGDISGGEE